MTEAALLAAIYAAPDDDDVRLVYADFLQDRGDPRGEMIALQIAKSRGVLTQEQHARERELLAAHAARWLAPLPIRLPGVQFERGFVTRCEILTGVIDGRGSPPIVSAAEGRSGFIDGRGSPPIVSAAEGRSGFIDENPAWSTVRTVDSVPISDRCHVASLRALSSIGHGGVVQLARLARPLAVETLVWNGPEYWDNQRWNTADDAIRAWSQIRVLPKLRSLSLLGQATWIDSARGPRPQHLAWAWSSRYLPALVELAMPFAPALLPTWVDALEPTKLARIELRTASEDARASAWRAILQRDAHGRLSRLTLHAPARPPPNLLASQSADQLVAGVRALPPTLTEARVIVPGATWQAYATARAGLTAALALHPRARVTIDSAP